MKTFDLEHPGRTREHGKTVLLITLVLVLGTLYVHGMFDNVLYKVHLNYTTCGTNAFGATFCGDELKQYNKRFHLAR
jgi:hypothetical protein